MIHNIGIQAGVWTRMAQVGVWITSILATGDLRIRAEKPDGSVFETELVSGMTFDVKGGYHSVSFLSSVSQSAKIWMSENQLNWTPAESRMVGSSALVSSVGSVYYGAPTELLAATVGRGRITINPTEDIYIGGVGFSSASAIKIDGGSLFELRTQGALFAYSLNANSVPVYSSVVNELATLTEAAGYGGLYGGGGSLEMAGGSASYPGRVYSVGGSKVVSVTNDANRVGSTVYDAIDGWLDSRAIVVNGIYYVLKVVTASPSERWLVAIDMSDGTYTETLVYTHTVSGGIIDWAFDGVNIAIGVEHKVVAYGPISGPLIARAVPASLDSCSSIHILNDGALFVADGNTCTYSDDGGVTYSAYAAIGNNSYISNLVEYDGDALYVMQGSAIRKSIDKGVSWHQVHATSDSGFRSMVVKAGVIAAISFDNVHAQKADGTFVVLPILGLTGANASGVGFTATGEIYFYNNGDFKILHGKPIISGGVSVAMLEEVN
ncbi:MAG: hypothetical protein COA78_36785 [Blastopirellula sp.]|nr:MAG: hypothetical protein COA78_36785 [Blastopirellula sp.]